MKVLVIGNGGREHAIGKKIIENNPSTKIFFYPGNGGTKLIGKNLMNNYSINDLSIFAKKNNIDLTIVGSEIFLMKKIVDVFNFKKLNIIGPNYLSAKLEGDKSYSKNFMKKYGVRTSDFKIFSSYKKAINFLDKENEKFFVIKTNGLAYGKGVIITRNKKEAKDTVKKIMIEKKFGDSGNKIIIEKYLEGKEISVMSIFNKKNIFPFIFSKDYKKIGNNEVGLNTGGMGAIAPVSYVNNSIYNDLKKNILEPTLEGLITEKLTFSGFIYFGIIISFGKVYLLEYNVRMGDPETQALLPLMESSFLEIMENSLLGKKISISWKKLHSCCIVLSSKGYPDKYEIGKTIKGMKSLQDCFYIAGAEKKNKKWITNGGRVLNIIGVSSTPKKAREIAYKKVSNVQFENLYFRKDIGL